MTACVRAPRRAVAELSESPADRRGSAQPLVSVVIPFRNAKRFLGEAVASVQAQSYRHWELLLVDDASDDGSRSLAESYAAQDPTRVRRLEHPGGTNRGVSASRNLGIRHARGEYLAFLDSDDVWLPRKLEEQVAYLEQHPDAALVYGRMRYWYSWSGRPDDAARDYEPDPGVPAGTVLAPPRLLTALLEGRARAPLPSDTLLRLATVRDVGGFEEQRAFSVHGREIYEDRMFFVKIALVGGVYVADRCWVMYRQHEDSSSTIVERSGGRGQGRKAYLAWLESYLCERGHRGTHLWHLARRRSLPYRHPLADKVLRRLQRARTTIARLVTRSGIARPARGSRG